MKTDRILCFLFVFFSVFHQIGGAKDDLLYLRSAQVIGLICFIRVFLTDYKLFLGQNILALRRPVIFIGVCIISAIVVEFAHMRFYLMNLVYPISFLSVTLLVMRSKPSPTPYFLLASGVFILFMVNFSLGVSASDWVKGSRNHTSVLAIYLALMVLLISKVRDGKVSKGYILSVPIGALIISVMAVGRSGILSSLLLYTVCMLSSSQNRKFKSALVLNICAMAVLGYFVSVNFDYLFDMFLYKFDTKQLDLDGRDSVFNAYFQSLDTLAVIFSYSDLSFLMTTYGLTLHNSYLHWHYSYGIGIILLAAIILRSLFDFARTDLFLCGLLIVILARSFSDQVLLSDGILLGLPLILLIAQSEYSKSRLSRADS